MIDFDKIRDDVLKWPCSRVQEVQMALIEGTPLFDIEVSSMCNIECMFCPRDKIVRKNRFLNPKTFDMLYKWLPDNAIVMFSGLGECLLNKDLGSYIRKLKERNISSCIVTNGILLTPEKQEELIERGIDQIQISYLTPDKCRYYELTGNRGDFKSLDHNLQHLSDIKTADFRVQLNFLDLDFNKNDILAVKDVAIRWGFDLFYRRKHSRGGLLFKPDSDFDYKESCFRCGTFASAYFISSDGDILSCCNDTEALNILGNIASSDYSSVVNNKLTFLMDKNEFEICKKCTDDYRWYTLWNSSYEKSISSLRF